MWRAAVDIAVIVIAAAVALGVWLEAEPRDRFFVAGDPTLSYPVVDESVSFALLLLLVILVSVAVLAFVTFVFASHIREIVLPIVRRALLAFVLVALLVHVTEVFVGELRPNFLAVCEPDGEGECTNSDSDAVRQARMSFPSGHAALAMATAVFWSLAIRDALAADVIDFGGCNSDSQTRAVHWAALLFVGMASLVGMSRIIDYQHHAWDVIAGNVLGALVAFLCYPHHGKLYPDQAARIGAAYVPDVRYRRQQ